MLVNRRLKIVSVRNYLALDWKLNFDGHISDVCKKANEKLNALARIALFIGLSKRHT